MPKRLSFYWPTGTAAMMTLDVFTAHLSASGLHCSTKPEGPNMVLIVFPGYPSTLHVLLELKDDRVVHADFEFTDPDAPLFAERVDEAVWRVDFSVLTAKPNRCEFCPNAATFRITDIVGKSHNEHFVCEDHAMSHRFGRFSRRGRWRH